MWGLIIIFTQINDNNMLTIHNENKDFPYKLTELYDEVGLAKAAYAKWTAKHLLLFIEGKDYISSFNLRLSKQGRGNFRQDYLLTKRTAEEMALMSFTEKGKKVRKDLLDLKDSAESGDILTQDQFLFLLDLIRAFSYIANQVAIEEAHKASFFKTYANSYSSPSQIAVSFHKVRNEALNISPQELQRRKQAYMDSHQKDITTDRKRAILAIIDKNLLVSHSVYDFFSSLGKEQAMAIKMSSFVDKITAKMSIEFRPANEVDLFHSEVERFPDIVESKIEPRLPPAKHERKVLKDKEKRLAITKGTLFGG